MPTSVRVSAGRSRGRAGGAAPVSVTKKGGGRTQALTSPPYESRVTLPLAGVQVSSLQDPRDVVNMLLRVHFVGPEGQNLAPENAHERLKVQK